MNKFHLEPAGLFEGVFLLHHDGHQTVFTVTETPEGWIGRERARLRERKKILAGPCEFPEQVIEALLHRGYMDANGNLSSPPISERAREIHRRGPGR